MGTKSSCNHHNVHPADRAKKNLVDLERPWSVGVSINSTREKGLGGYHHRSPFPVPSFLSFLRLNQRVLQPDCRQLSAARQRNGQLHLPFTSLQVIVGACCVCVCGET